MNGLMVKLKDIKIEKQADGTNKLILPEGHPPIPEARIGLDVHLYPKIDKVDSIQIEDGITINQLLEISPVYECIYDLFLDEMNAAVYNQYDALRLINVISYYTLMILLHKSPEIEWPNIERDLISLMRQDSGSGEEINNIIIVGVYLVSAGYSSKTNSTKLFLERYRKHIKTSKTLSKLTGDLLQKIRNKNENKKFSLVLTLDNSLLKRMIMVNGSYAVYVVFNQLNPDVSVEAVYDRFDEVLNDLFQEISHDKVRVNYYYNKLSYAVWYVGNTFKMNRCFMAECDADLAVVSFQDENMKKLFADKQPAGNLDEVQPSLKTSDCISMAIGATFKKFRLKKKEFALFYLVIKGVIDKHCTQEQVLNYIKKADVPSACVPKLSSLKALSSSKDYPDWNIQGVSISEKERYEDIAKYFLDEYNRLKN